MNENNLASAIARNHFGPVVGETVRILLTNPGSALSEITKRGTAFCNKQYAEKNKNAPQLSDDSISDLFRDSLAVLMQHGIAYTVDSRGSLKKPPKETPAPHSKAWKRARKLRRTFDIRYLYSIDLQCILFRSRIPLYLGFARKRYGDVGAAAVRAIFERGRMTSKQLFETALEPILSELEISLVDAEACLTDMAQSGLLCWVGKRRFESRKAQQENEGIEQNGVENQNGVQGGQENGEQMRGRKRLRTDGDSDSDDDKALLPRGYDDIQVGRGDHRIIVGAPSKNNNEDTWGISFWHLNREFRNECCIIVAQGRVQHQLAMRILRAGLQISLDNEDCEVPSEDFESADVPTDSIQKLLADEVAAFSAHEFWDAVQILVNHTPQFVVAIPEHSPTALRFIPGRLIADARQKTAEHLLLHRYGGIGRRVFRALAIEGGMEEKVLAEKCMLPLKVARETLFRMYQDRIISIQEVPRSHDQQRASNWYYLWQANTISVFRNMTQVMYKAVLNLFVRLEALEAKEVSDNEQKQKEINEHKAVVLGYILRMDQSIMVIRDFGPVTTAYFPAHYRITDGPMGRMKKR